MAATLDEVLTLAKSTHALSQEQLSRILALAPTMGESDLERLKTTLMGVQTAEENSAKAQLAVYKEASLAQTQWRFENQTKGLQQEEAKEVLQDAATADQLISNL